VEHETSVDSSSPVTLCLSKHRLSLLVVSADNDDLFDVQAEYNINSIVCWKLHVADRDAFTYLIVTVAPDGDLANGDYTLCLKKRANFETV